jgi:hypothetical protein
MVTERRLDIWVEDALADFASDLRLFTVNLAWAMLWVAAAFIPVQLAISPVQLPVVWRIEATAVGAVIVTAIGVIALVHPRREEARALLVDAFEWIDDPALPTPVVVALAALRPWSPHRCFAAPGPLAARDAFAGHDVCYLMPARAKRIHRGSVAARDLLPVREGRPSRTMWSPFPTSTPRTCRCCSATGPPRRRLAGALPRTPEPPTVDGWGASGIGKGMTFDDDVRVLESELTTIEQTFRGLSADDWRSPTKLMPVDDSRPHWTLFELAGHFDISIGLTRMLIADPQDGQIGRDRVSFFIMHRQEVAPVVYDYAYTMVAGKTPEQMPDVLHETFSKTIEESRATPPATVGPGYFALMRLDEFVPSRVVEAVVHGLDSPTRWARPDCHRGRRRHDRRILTSRWPAARCPGVLPTLRRPGLGARPRSRRARTAAAAAGLSETPRGRRPRRVGAAARRRPRHPARSAGSRLSWLRRSWLSAWWRSGRGDERGIAPRSQQGRSQAGRRRAALDPRDGLATLDRPGRCG